MSLNKKYKLEQHTPEDVEVLKLSLDPEKYPKFFTRKVAEFTDLGLSQEEAEAEVRKWMADFELEIYYEPHMGAWSVESEALEAGANLFSPFSKRKVKPLEDF